MFNILIRQAGLGPIYVKVRAYDHTGICQKLNECVI